MKKYQAVNKRNGKDFIVSMMEDKAITREVGTDKVKEVSLSTIKRWFELGEEIVEAQKVEKKEVKKSRPSATKKDGSVRNDKFRPKLTVEEVIEIRNKFKSGSKKSHLAKEYNVSFRTITCIVEYIMWKNVG